ncbi:MAG: pantoate--beta-alanine ligase [Micromonosporaceae bacterium]
MVNDRTGLAQKREKLVGRVATVMTMGALHEGHIALLRAARATADHVVCTIFVNPLQFGPNEDLARYPRMFDADLAICAAEGVDLIFAPTTDVVYPQQPLVRVNPGPLGEVLEGASRPGFFHGVLTVVLKLLHLTRPDVACFGQKDYQQLTLVRQMVVDFDIATEILAVPTIRESDGLALSSRNSYLSAQERLAALTLPRALEAGQRASVNGAEAALAAARALFDSDQPAGPGAVGTPQEQAVPVELDYLVVTDPSLGPAPARGEARMLAAARVGATRLIDNVALTVGGT